MNAENLVFRKISVKSCNVQHCMCRKNNVEYYAEVWLNNTTLPSRAEPLGQIVEQKFGETELRPIFTTTQ